MIIIMIITIADLGLKHVWAKLFAVHVKPGNHGHVHIQVFDERICLAACIWVVVLIVRVLVMVMWRRRVPCLRWTFDVNFFNQSESAEYMFEIFAFYIIVKIADEESTRGVLDVRVE